MRWSWQVARVSGIPIRVHSTFLALLVFVGVSGWMRNGGARAAYTVLFVLLLFVCVVLHELGHSLVALAYGIRVRDITLLPIGGVARLERMPEKPRQELLLAAAGPTVSFVIAAAIFTGLFIGGTVSPLTQVSLLSPNLLKSLMLTNLFLGAFNLLPAFPMDGGRILRALLAQRMDYLKATRIAALTGQGLAIALGFWGLLGNQLALILIALFVYVGAVEEARAAEIRAGFGDARVAEAMVTQFQALSPTDSLERAIQYLLGGSQQDFPVVEGSQVVGLLTRADLLVALAQQGTQTAVGSIMRREFEAVSPEDRLEQAFVRMRGRECFTVPVLHQGILVGILTLENIGEFVMVQGAIRKSARNL